MTTSLNTLASLDEQAAFITQLIQSQRFISEFLLQEVLNRQDETIRSFLLRTSILSILDIPLCHAVTERDDVQQILTELERRNLLATIVDQDRLVWRYPNFIAEFLRQCLTQEMPADLPELHRRAAKAEQFPDRAIAHYLAAELWTEAAQLIEQIGDALLTQGLSTTLRNWLYALPTPVREESPQLLYLLGACTWHREDHTVGQTCLERALQGFEAAGDAVGQGKALAALSNCVLFQGDVMRGQALRERALAGSLSVDPGAIVDQPRLVESAHGPTGPVRDRSRSDLDHRPTRARSRPAASTRSLFVPCSGCSTRKSGLSRTCLLPARPTPRHRSPTPGKQLNRQKFTPAATSAIQRSLPGLSPARRRSPSRR